MMTRFDRRRSLGLVAGSLVRVVLPVPFAVWALVAVRTNFAELLLGAIVALAGVLIGFGVAMIGRSLRLPALTTVDPAQARGIKLQYGAIVAAEYVGIAAVVILCRMGNDWKLIAPLIDIVVGLHFFPLARLFKLPRLNLAGALFCLIPVVTMLLIPSSTCIGHALAWFVLPSVGCALAGMATAWDGLNEVRKLLGGGRSEAGSGLVEA